MIRAEWSGARVEWCFKGWYGFQMSLLFISDTPGIYADMERTWALAFWVQLRYEGIGKRVYLANAMHLFKANLITWFQSRC